MSKIQEARGSARQQWEDYLYDKTSFKNPLNEIKWVDRQCKKENCKIIYQLEQFF